MPEGEGEDGEEEEASPLLECFFQTSVRNANFRVQPHSSPEEAARTEQLYVALDQQLQSLLAGEGGPAAAASAKERATFLAESMGRTAVGGVLAGGAAPCLAKVLVRPELGRQVGRGGRGGALTHPPLG